MAPSSDIAPVRVTAPAVTPVSVAEAKQHLRVEHDEEDATIELLVATATERFDGLSGLLGRCLVEQTWRQDRPAFPEGPVLRLPFADVTAASVAYVDEAGATQTLSSSLWRLATDALGSMLVLDDAATWPTTDDRPAAVSVTMTVGYGAASADVPAPIRAAILMLTGHLWRNRDGGGGEMPAIVAMMVEPYWRVGL